MHVQQPPLLRIDFRSQAFKQNPFPTLARLREAGPLVRTRIPIFGKVWMATTYEAVNTLLHDHRHFIQNPVAAGNRLLPRLFRWLPRNLRPLTMQMLMRDEPDHRRLRRLVEQAFLRHSVDTLRPRLTALVDQELDGLARAGAASPGGVDLLTHFARLFPLAVISKLLGLPPEDRPRFVAWAARFTTANSLPAMIWSFRRLNTLVGYVREEIARQTQRPRTGLLAALIQAEESGDRLSEDELVAMVLLLLVAGHLTTVHQLTGSVLLLLDHPDQLGQLTADWTLADSAVEELLRHLSFAQVTKPRFAREDGVLFSQAIQRGEMLIACLASANSDPAEFPDPERFDIHRQPNRQLAFGTGIHVCLGAPLARAEMTIALERLFTRFPNLKLAVPRSQIRFKTRFGSRELASLPVRW